jgi:hypothetical protein
MKRAVVFAFATVLALGSLDLALAAPAVKARPVVPLPTIGMSRQGGAPIQTVSRGLRPDTQRPLDLKGLATPLEAKRLLPQRAQVLALRHRVVQRFRGSGRGARLAMELP